MIVMADCEDRNNFATELQHDEPREKKSEKERPESCQSPYLTKHSADGWILSCSANPKVAQSNNLWQAYCKTCILKIFITMFHRSIIRFTRVVLTEYLTSYTSEPVSLIMP